MRRNARFSFVFWFCVCACGRTQPTPPPAVSHASAQPAPSSPPPNPEEPMTKPSAPAFPSAPELARRVVAALSARGLGFRLSPVLPVDWPPQRAELEWLAYDVEPLPTGIVSYALKGPVYRVTVGLPGSAPEVSAVTNGKPLGVDSRIGVSAAPAEQALVDVIAGARSAESARAELSSYGAWASAEGAVGEDVRRRHAAFFAWLGAAH